MHFVALFAIFLLSRSVMLALTPTKKGNCLKAYYLFKYLESELSVSNETMTRTFATVCGYGIGEKNSQDASDRRLWAAVVLQATCIKFTLFLSTVLLFAEVGTGCEISSLNPICVAS